MKRIKLFLTALVLSLSSVFTLAIPTALAASITWDGSESSDVTNDDNWVGGTAPGSGDTAVFPSDLGGATETINFPSSVAWTAISFSDDDGTTRYALEGTGPLTLTGGIVNASGNYQTVEVPIVLGASQTFDMQTNIEFSGTVNLASYTLTVDQDPLDGGLFGTAFSGVVSGSGGITKTGTGLLFLSAANLYTGATAISAGTVYGYTTTALGTSASGTTVASGALLLFNIDGDVTVAEPLTLTGDGTKASLIAAYGFCTEPEPYSTLTFSGAITLSSDVLVRSCTKNGKITGAITGAHEISLHEDSTGTFEIASDSNDSSTPNGVLSLEAKTTEYNDDSPGTSITVHANETAIVKGTYGGVTINSGGILKGTGTVSGINSSGTIAPGLSPGCLTSGSDVSIFGGSYQWELGGTTACTGYDQLIVTGNVAVSGGTLDVSRYNNFVPKAGQKYVIVSNDGSDATTGNFTDLDEGATFTADGVTFSISYVGGDGNDIELTVTAVSPDTGFALLTNNPYVTMALMLGAAGAIALMARKNFRPAFATRRKR